MRLQDEGMWPELWKDPRTDLHSLANNFPVFCAARRIFFYSRCTLVGPLSRVEKVHKFLQEENISRVFLLETKYTKSLKLSTSVTLGVGPVVPY